MTDTHTHAPPLCGSCSHRHFRNEKCVVSETKVWDLEDAVDRTVAEQARRHAEGRCGFGCPLCGRNKSEAATDAIPQHPCLAMLPGDSLSGFFNPCGKVDSEKMMTYRGTNACCGDHMKLVEKQQANKG